MQKLKVVLHSVDMLNEWAGRIVIPLPFILMALIAVEAMLRYFFNKPTMWSGELCQYLFILLTVWGAGYALRYNRHIGCDVMSSHLTGKIKGWVALPGGLLALIYCGVMVWTGAGWSWKSLMMREMSETLWRGPLYIVKLVIFVGLALFLLQGLAYLTRNIITAATGREE